MLLNNQPGEGLGKAWNLKCTGKSKDRGAVWLLRQENRCWWCLEFEQRDQEKAREEMCIHLTEKRLATANGNPDSSDENFSCLSLIHDPSSWSVFQAATAPTVLKNQLMLRGKSLLQQAHTDSWLSHSWEQRQPMVMLSFIQEVLESGGHRNKPRGCLSGAFSTDDFILQVQNPHTWLFWWSQCLRNNPPVAVSLCREINPAVPPIPAAQLMLQLTQFCTGRAKPHSQPCFSKSQPGPDLPAPSFLAGRVSGYLPGQVWAQLSVQPSLAMISLCSPPEL